MTLILGFLLVTGAVRAAALPTPVILFWTAYPYDIPHLTHFTPNVGLGDDTATSFSQRRLQSSGIVPLKSVPGKVLAGGLSSRGLADRWIAARRQGYVAIAIDEFGSPDAAVNDRMIEALELTHAEAGDLFIAVWHAGNLSASFRRAYARCADLVLLETYVSGTSGLALAFGPKLLQARLGGILAKTVFALGINDVDRRLGSTVQPWANSVAEIRAQVRWVRDHAPEMPGIAFFASHASFEIQREAAMITWSEFADP